MVECKYQVGDLLRLQNSTYLCVLMEDVIVKGETDSNYYVHWLGRNPLGGNTNKIMNFWSASGLNKEFVKVA